MLDDSVEYVNGDSLLLKGLVNEKMCPIKVKAHDGGAVGTATRIVEAHDGGAVGTATRAFETLARRARNRKNLRKVRRQKTDPLASCRF